MAKKKKGWAGVRVFSSKKAAYNDLKKIRTFNPETGAKVKHIKVYSVKQDGTTNTISGYRIAYR